MMKAQCQTYLTVVAESCLLTHGRQQIGMLPGILLSDTQAVSPSPLYIHIWVSAYGMVCAFRLGLLPSIVQPQGHSHWQFQIQSLWKWRFTITHTHTWDVKCYVQFLWYIEFHYMTATVDLKHPNDNEQLDYSQWLTKQVCHKILVFYFWLCNTVTW